LPIVTIPADAIAGQYGFVQIRPFEAADAPAAAELVQPIREIVTANDDDNVPMLTLNERLGYRRLYSQIELAREL
jgi:hypothetical protein